MADFDHAWWQGVQSDIALLPMPTCTAHLVEILLTRDEIEEPSGGHEQIALARLVEFGLVDMFPPDWDDAFPTYRPKFRLRELADRGLLPILGGHA
jgi:hypothetical protein